MRAWATFAIASALCLVMSNGALSQTRPAASTPPAADAGSQTLKADQLDQLVAPIALYPDTLLAEILMASTYPLEVVQADRWVKDNKALKDDALKAAVDKQAWDESVKSLVATPSVLADMSAKLDWTQKLGDAVLAQQADVMDAVQRLRTKAQANKTLASTKEQKVSVQKVDSKEVIVIEPAVPETVYVPYYDPATVYGAWAYPAYPPYLFPPPGYIAAGVIRTGLVFGAGYAVGRWTSGGNYWGGGVNWGGNNINVNRPVNINNVKIGSNNWQHNSTHRHGVKYNNTNVQQKFGNNNIRAGSNERLDFRGHSGNQVLKPGGERGNLGDRTPGNRANMANRGPDRPNAGNRPSPGKAAGAHRPQRDTALGNIGSGKAAFQQGARGKASLGNRGGGGRPHAAPRGGGRPHAGGGGRGGGRRR